MKKFSQLLDENKSKDSFSILQSEITSYINKVKQQLPVNIQKIIYLTKKYNLTNAEQLDEIRNSTKPALKKLVDVFNISLEELVSLWEMLKGAKKNIRMLPQYQSETERKELEAGRLSMDDLTIDLNSPTGRSAASKMYMPIVMTVVNQFVGKSRLNKSELMSAGLMALTNAMNDWQRDTKNNKKSVSFKTYLGYRVKQQILNDMNNIGHTLGGTNWYATKKYGSTLLDATSFDDLTPNEYSQIDKLDVLGVEDPIGNEFVAWESLYKLLEKSFSVRDTDIFYRFFGLNGRKREKSKDIAKSYGMSEGNIRNTIINKMLKWLRTNPKANDMLSNLRDLYTEHLMCDMLNNSKEQIIEQLAEDDIYILLEELNRWRNKTTFENALRLGLKAAKLPEITNMLKGGFDEIDSNIKTYKKDIIIFLSCMYPSEKFSNRSDVELIEYMQEVSDAYKKYKPQI